MKVCMSLLSIFLCVDLTGEGGGYMSFFLLLFFLLYSVCCDISCIYLNNFYVLVSALC